MTTVAGSEALTSWTRTLNQEDALTLIDGAHPGTSIQEWAALADRILPQGSPARRRELIRIVKDELLDLRDGVIVGSAWLRLFQDGSPHRRLGLLFGRLWRSRPLVLRAMEGLVRPALDVIDRPLAPLDADVIEAEAWDRFLRSTLRPDVPHEAFVKTRSTLQGALRDVGVLAITGHRGRTLRVQHGRPEPVAFAWVVANELLARGEESEAWALHASFAARLFAPKADYASICLDAGAAAGLLRRGYLMGQSRLQLGPEMP